MQISQAGLNLTEVSEGLRLESYQDTGGVWTIGYGHTHGVRPNQKITKEVAVQLLGLDVQSAVNCVNTHCLPCTQGQFDALCDFVFNVGPSQFLSSHLFLYHKNGEYEKAAAEFPKWKYDNGKIIPGLEARRLREQALYTSQELPADHPQTSVQECSAQSTGGSVSASPGQGAVQSSQAQPSPSQGTVPESGNVSVESLFPDGDLLHNLLNKLQEKED